MSEPEGDLTLFESFWICTTLAQGFLRQWWKCFHQLQHAGLNRISPKVPQSCKARQTWERRCLEAGSSNSEGVFISRHPSFQNCPSDESRFQVLMNLLSMGSEDATMARLSRSGTRGATQRESAHSSRTLGCTNETDGGHGATSFYFSCYHVVFMSQSREKIAKVYKKSTSKVCQCQLKIISYCLTISCFLKQQHSPRRTEGENTRSCCRLVLAPVSSHQDLSGRLHWSWIPPKTLRKP